VGNLSFPNCISKNASQMLNGIEIWWLRRCMQNCFDTLYTIAYVVSYMLRIIIMLENIIINNSQFLCTDMEIFLQNFSVHFMIHYVINNMWTPAVHTYILKASLACDYWMLSLHLTTGCKIWIYLLIKIPRFSSAALEYLFLNLYLTNYKIFALFLTVFFFFSQKWSIIDWIVDQSLSTSWTIFRFTLIV